MPGLCKGPLGAGRGAAFARRPKAQSPRLCRKITACPGPIQRGPARPLAPRVQKRQNYEAPSPGAVPPFWRGLLYAIAGIAVGLCLFVGVVIGFFAGRVYGGAVEQLLKPPAAQRHKAEPPGPKRVPHATSGRQRRKPKETDDKITLRAWL